MNYEAVSGLHSGSFERRTPRRMFYDRALDSHWNTQPPLEWFARGQTQLPELGFHGPASNATARTPFDQL
eukprot:1439566-Alexandrium_andersonii.AAC.1